jgi:hypothetical protein
MVNVCSQDPPPVVFAYHSGIDVVHSHDLPDVFYIFHGEQRKSDVSRVDLPEQRVHDVRRPRRAVDIQWGFTPVVPRGQQKLSQIANVIVVMVSDKDQVDLLWFNTDLCQLCCNAASCIKQEFDISFFNQERGSLPIWLWDGRACTK